MGSFVGGNTAALGTFSLSLSEDKVSSSEYEKITENICSAADHYIELEESQGYGLPYAQSTLSYNDSDKGYLWGSNSFVADNSIVMAYAYMLTKNDEYIDGVIGGLDYLLGRNAMNYSYVTGYGENAIQNPHHRYWANQVDSEFPKAPCGVLSGGPNSGMQDPWVKGSGWNKGEIAPQKCYMDHIEAWSVNECTINWNASLAWLTGFSAQENGGIIAGSTGSSAGVSNSADEERPTKSDDEEENDKKPSKTTKADSDDDSDSDSEGSSKSDKNSDDSDDKGNIGVIALIAGAAVVGLISIELFVYKMLKLKKK